jgi:hypothetical protein
MCTRPTAAKCSCSMNPLLPELLRAIDMTALEKRCRSLPKGEAAREVVSEILKALRAARILRREASPLSTCAEIAPTLQMVQDYASDREISMSITLSIIDGALWGGQKTPAAYRHGLGERSTRARTQHADPDREGSRGRGRLGHGDGLSLLDHDNGVRVPRQVTTKLAGGDIRLPTYKFAGPELGVKRKLDEASR